MKLDRADSSLDLVLGRPLHAIDDDDFDGAFGGLQFQSELLSKGCEDGRAVGCLRIRNVIQRSISPLQMEIICPRQTGLVDDRPPHRSGNVSGQRRQAHALSIERAAYSVLRYMGKSAKRCAPRAGRRGRRRIQGINCATAFLGLLQSPLAAGTSQFVHGQLLRLAMEGQLKPLDEKRLKHRTFHLLNGSIAHSLGLDVVTVGTYPGWAAGNLIISNTVRKNHESSGSEVLNQKSPRNRLNQRPIRRAWARFDRCDLKRRRRSGRVRLAKQTTAEHQANQRQSFHNPLQRR
jgi:hypothetical protein